MSVTRVVLFLSLAALLATGPVQAMAAQSAAETGLYEQIRNLSADLQELQSREAALKSAAEKAVWADKSANAALRSLYLDLSATYRRMSEVTRNAYWMTRDERQNQSADKLAANAEVYAQNARVVDENARIRKENDRQAQSDADLLKDMHSRMKRIKAALSGPAISPARAREIRADLDFLRTNRTRLSPDSQDDLDRFLSQVVPDLDNRLKN